MDFRFLKENLYKATHERNGLTRYVTRRFLFRPLEWLGLHVVADHFYEPIPNLREIEENYDDSPLAIPGHPLDLQNFELCHAKRLERFGPEFTEAVKQFDFDPINNYFKGADALSYYCLLRDLKSESVVEIGQGSSTRIALAALDRNAAENGTAPKLTSIDPYARLGGQLLKPVRTEFKEIREPLQKLPPEDLLKSCDGNALLFVDGSHIYKYGSDVWYLLHKIYPRLPPGCLLHLHDIVLPYGWLKDFYLRQKWFWNEQDMIEAFLAFNKAFEIFLPVYWVHRDSKLVREVVARIVPQLPIRDLGYSFYIRRVA